MSRASGQYFAGVLVGIGAGFGFSTVIYRHFPGSDTQDTMTILGFALLLSGVFCARRLQRNQATTAEDSTT